MSDYNAAHHLADLLELTTANTRIEQLERENERFKMTLHSITLIKPIDEGYEGMTTLEFAQKLARIALQETVDVSPKTNEEKALAKAEGEHCYQENDDA